MNNEVNNVYMSTMLTSDVYNVDIDVYIVDIDVNNVDI